MVEALNDLNIPYFVGGSLATAVHTSRGHNDVDILAKLLWYRSAVRYPTGNGAMFLASSASKAAA